jgi:hypothetical protein
MMSVAQAEKPLAAADQTIPVLDLARYRAGESGALAALAAQLRQACEQPASRSVSTSWPGTACPRR